MLVKGKNVVITGSPSKLGNALAHRLVNAGAFVILANQDEQQAILASQLNSHRVGSAAYKYCDVSQKYHVESLLDFVQSAFGSIDIVCNNAVNCSQLCNVQQISQDQTHQNLDDLSQGTLLAMEIFKKQSTGVIINILNLQSTLDLSDEVTESAIRLTQSINYSKRSNIRVNTISTHQSETDVNPVALDALMRTIIDDSIAGSFVNCTRNERLVSNRLTSKL
ncbi:hypothetical protein BC833DRAFT_607063 [Globomyces pollinis-pini]|nr:hypothetical protein BC833DRAFT_607063 [Globomyces pollinis-pini]